MMSVIYLFIYFLPALVKRPLPLIKQWLYLGCLRTFLAVTSLIQISRFYSTNMNIHISAYFPRANNLKLINCHNLQIWHEPKKSYKYIYIYILIGLHLKCLLDPYRNTKKQSKCTSLKFTAIYWNLCGRFYISKMAAALSPIPQALLCYDLDSTFHLEV